MSDIPLFKRARKICDCGHALFRHYYGGMCLANFECKCTNFKNGEAND